MSKTPIILLWCLIAILSGGHVCAQDPNLTPVTLQLKWRHQFNFAGYYAAKEKGYFKDAGLDVTIKEGLPGVDFIDEVVKGRADYGIEMPDLLISRAKGKPVVALAAIFQHSPYVLLASKESGITSPQDAVGKTVMMRQASAAELRIMFTNEGVNLKDIHVVPHSWNLNDLIDGKVDAIGAYLTDQPHVLEEKGISHVIIRPRSYGIDFYGDCLFTSENKLNQAPDQVRAFRAACIKGWAYAMKHPDEMIDIIKNTYKSSYSKESMHYEFSVLQKEIILPDLVDIGHMNPGRWAHILETYKTLGMIDGDVNLNAFIYDPEHHGIHAWLHKPWVRVTLTATGAIFCLTLGLLVLLYLFNKRLQRQVKKKTQEVVRNEEQFRALFNNYFQLTGLLETDGRIRMVNAAALDMIGKSMDDVKDKYFWETPWWEHSSSLQEQLKHAVTQAANGELVRFDTIHLAADGSTHYIDFSIKPVKDSEGNIISLLPEGRDITEKKLSEERYQKLFDQAADAIVILKEGKVVECNQMALELFECDRDWLIGSNLEKISTNMQEGGDATELAAKHLDDALTSGSASFEWRHATAKDNQFIASVSLSRLMFGESDYVQGIIRDISASKELEERLRLAQKMEAIGTLAGGIAHDFNNILAGILGFNELALNEAEKGSRMETYLQEMLNAGERAKELVDQILTFSRHSEKGKQSVLISDLIEDALKLLRATIPVTVELKANLQSSAHVFADPTQLHQVIMNLCTNAYHALEHHSGKITVSLKDVELTNASFSDAVELPPGPYVQLNVRDTGIGMTRETLQKIFEPYFTTKEMGKGTGLGLAVVHGIVSNHNGHITVDSTPGSGTTFSVWLPVTDKPGASANTREDMDLLTGNGQHILFVDDEKTIVRLSEESLSTAGYTVSGFTSPTEALDAFKNDHQSFDIIITDMTMPGMSGREMIEQIKHVRDDIPIIMCSGYNEDMNRSKALEAGVSEYLLKPVSTKTLLGTLKSLLNHHT